MGADRGAGLGRAEEQLLRMQPWREEKRKRKEASKNLYQSTLKSAAGFVRAAEGIGLGRANM